MNRLSRRDALCFAAVAVLVGLLAVGAGRGKGKNVPSDDRHRMIYEAIKGRRDRADTELICITCHNKSSLPLPKDHPPKEQCLLCHLPIDDK